MMTMKMMREEEQEREKEKERERKQIEIVNLCGLPDTQRTPVEYWSVCPLRGPQ
jgi:hypothetical protein